MVIRVYISGNSGNKEIVTHQQRIFMILNSLGIPNEPVDISAPGMEKERDFMREKGKKKEGQRHALPPQIFNGEEYRGDFDDFDVANEDDVLEEFLGITKKDPNLSKPNGTHTDEQNKEKTAKDKLGDEPMATEEIVEKEEPVEEAPQPEVEPLPPVVEATQPDDHEKPEELPAKPEGELIPVEPVEAAEVVEPEPEEEPVVAETGAHGAGGINGFDLPPQLNGKTVIQDDSDSEDEDYDVKIPAKPVQPEITKPVFPVEKIICPGTPEYDDLMKKRIEESEENNLGQIQDIPALGPSLLPGEVPMPDKKPVKLVIEVDEVRARAGFQNIVNAGRFWKASQMIGTP